MTLINTLDISKIDFAKGDGLIPAVVQDADTLQVLTLAYMDEAALRETLDSGQATFFSRSRGGRWRKGETSGDFLNVVSVTPDCDGDAVVVKVRPVGATGRVRLRLPRGLAPATLLMLRSDDDWLDFRYFPAPGGGGDGDSSVIWDLPGADASVLVAGSSVFGKGNIAENIARLREAAERVV